MKRSPPNSNPNFNQRLNISPNNTHKRFRNDSFPDRPSTSSDITSDNLENCSRSFSHLANGNRIADPHSRTSKLLLDYFTKNVQSHDCFQRKIELKEALYHMLKDVFPYLGVYIVGSSANGFGTSQSDVDICLMLSREELNQKTEAIYLLRLIGRALRKAAFIRNLQVIAAKVPIVKFHDFHNKIECDININNHVGIRNTHLLRCYSEQDWRVRPLVLNVKRWAKFHNINDASQQTMSSYSLTLMTIFYLQNVCNPPVLPVLQKLYSDKFNIETDVSQLRLNEDLPVFTSNNTQSLGELFSGFLEYYSNFNFEYCVISVRTGNIIPKNCLPREVGEYENSRYSQWKYILIEEPFDLSNTARSVFDIVIFKEIKQVFRRSSAKLSQTKSIESIFNEPFYYPYRNDNNYSRNNSSNNNNNIHSDDSEGFR